MLEAGYAFTRHCSCCPITHQTCVCVIWQFDSGPSLFSGLSIERSPNPLKHVLDFIEEEVDWLTYDTWGVVLPEGKWRTQEKKHS